MDEDPEEKRGPWKWVAIGLAGLAVVVTAVVVLMPSKAPQRHAVTMTTKITLPPPPPPPPPPPKPPEPQKVENTPPKMTDPTPSPAPAKPSPPKANPAPPGQPLTGEAGAGANPYGLAVGNGGGNTIGGGGGEGGGGNGFGAFAGKLTGSIQSALQRNERTRFLKGRLELRLWLNEGGQITRAQVKNSSGDAGVDEAIRQVINGLFAGDRAPSSMPQPVTVLVRLG